MIVMLLGTVKLEYASSKSRI